MDPLQPTDGIGAKGGLVNDGEFEDYLVLEDIINQVYSGRTKDHKCPFCGKADLTCTVEDFTMRIECPSCGKFFEGALA